MDRKTKIIATLGPATDSRDAIGGLIDAGVNVFRLNMSHGNHDWATATCGHIRGASRERGVLTAILFDLQGPSIRTGKIEQPISLQPGDLVEFRNRNLEPGTAISVTTNYDGMSGDVAEGGTLLVDNGVLRFAIAGVEPGRVLCRVDRAGELGSRRHINLPGVSLSLPALSSKDRADARLAGDLEADFVALSFVRGAEHIEELRDLLETNKSPCPDIVAKIEDQEAVRNIDDIIVATDVVMIARGDLGIECPIEELPIIQRRTLKQCLRLGRRVIVATHMLESMIDNPIPTRAEVTDIANAVFEEADAIMLSGETTIGKFPVGCVQAMDRIARRIERSGGAGYAREAALERADEKTVNAAIVLANSIRDAAMVVFTRTGRVAHHVSHLRPRRAPIFAMVPDERVARRLLLDRAVIPVVLPFEADPNRNVDRAVDLLRKNERIASGQTLVVISDVRTGSESLDSILLREA